MKATFVGFFFYVSADVSPNNRFGNKGCFERGAAGFGRVRLPRLLVSRMDVWVLDFPFLCVFY